MPMPQIECEIEDSFSNRLFGEQERASVTNEDGRPGLCKAEAQLMMTQMQQVTRENAMMAEDIRNPDGLKQEV